MSPSTADIEIAVTEDGGEQVLRIPASFRLGGSRVRLHRDTPDGPVTLSYTRPEGRPEQRREWLERLFAAIDAAHAAGETFELERDFCPPRDVIL